MKRLQWNRLASVCYLHYHQKTSACYNFLFYADVRLCEYISYCLSQLSYTDKSMRKLIELFKTYEHALSEDSVMDNFRTIINKVRFVVASRLGLVFGSYWEFISPS